MNKAFLSASLLAALLLSAAQAQAGTPVMVQPPQSQSVQPQSVQPGVTFTLMYPLLAVPETTPVPSQVRYSMSRPADRLEVSGAPTGMIVRLTQDSVTIETRGATPGQYPLRITGYWGNERHAVELLVAVYATGGQGQVPAIVNTQPSTTDTTGTVPTTTAPAATVPTSPSTPTTTVTTPAPTPPAAPATPATSTTSTTSTTTVTPIPIPTPAPVTPAPVTIPTPAAQATVTVPPQQAPQVTTPATSTAPASESRNPFRAILPRLTGQGGRPATEGFTAWGGLGTGFNVGVSLPLGQVQAFNAALRGSAELLPTGGLGTPALGADLLLHRTGSNLYFGPSTAVALGSGNGLALGGLVGYASNLNSNLGYYLEGRARFGRLGGQTKFAPGIKLGVTYQLNR